jgi:alcohol dehydrogenase, propanol-preferring
MSLAAVLPRANSPLEFEDRQVPEPGPGQVLVRVAACGVCHSDLHLQEGWFPYTSWPVVPGHEVAGTIERVGDGVEWPEPGTRVGVPWLNDSCGHCPWCLAGDEVLCPERAVTGVSRDGGYQELMLAPAAFATPLPDGLPFLEAAPLLCAGLTVWGGIVHGGFRPDDRVAVIGLGGLGELAIRYAVAMGGRVAVISRSAAKAEEARELGAELFIDAGSTDPADALRRWGAGADLVLATAPSSELAQAAFRGLAPNGTLVMLGLDAAPIAVTARDLIPGRRRLMGSTTGTRRELRDALAFAAAHDVRPQVTSFGLRDANGVWEQLRDGRLRGRAVLEPSAS